MTDAFQYRQTVTKYIYQGEVDQKAQSEEDKVAAARELIGKPAPDQALDNAKALRERLMANKNKSDA